MATVHVRREEGNTWAIMLFWFTFFWFVDFSFSNTLPATEKTKQGTTDSLTLAQFFPHFSPLPLFNIIRTLRSSDGLAV
jgi:hypothetical protein